MRYFTLVILGLFIVGCSSNIESPPIRYINNQSDLSFSTYDSLEYYRIEKKFWDFGAQDPFITILYFKNQQYQKILQQIKQDTSYHIYQGRDEPEKAFSFYFKKYLSPVPICSMKKNMYRRDNHPGNGDVTIVFCNRLYFKHYLKGPIE